VDFSHADVAKSQVRYRIGPHGKLEPDALVVTVHIELWPGEPLYDPDQVRDLVKAATAHARKIGLPPEAVEIIGR
jgi:hypothetical protein